MARQKHSKAINICDLISVDHQAASDVRCFAISGLVANFPSQVLECLFES
jgi:hypothetical protein